MCIVRGAVSVLHLQGGEDFPFKTSNPPKYLRKGILSSLFSLMPPLPPHISVAVTRKEGLLKTEYSLCFMEYIFPWPLFKWRHWIKEDRWAVKWVIVARGSGTLFVCMIIKTRKDRHIFLGKLGASESVFFYTYHHWNDHNSGKGLSNLWLF